MLAARFLMPAALLMVAGCGGEIIAAPNVIAGPDTEIGEENVGRFRLLTPDTVIVGDEFSVVAEVGSGGSVAISLTGGPCREINEGLWLAAETGVCNFRGTQEATAEVDAAEQVSQSVTVEPAERELGSYTVLAPGSVRVDRRFEIAVSDPVGGPVSVAHTDGPCVALAGGRFAGTAEGTCTFVASQEASDSHTAGPDVTREVVILSPSSTIGSFEVLAKSSASVGEPFPIEIGNVVGGAVTVRSTSGACQKASPGLTSSVPKAFWFASAERSVCRFTVAQRNTSATPAGPTQTVTVVVQRAIGSFTLSAPAAVAVGEPIVVRVQDRVGGTVEIRPISGGCTGGAGKFSASSETTCVFAGVQRDSTTHSAGKTRQVQVVVTRPAGSFEFTVTPGTVQVGDQISVDVAKVVGGEVTYRLVSGPCSPTQSAIGVYIADEKGTCRWVASQRDSPTRAAAPDIERIVLVQPASLLPGSMTLTAPDSITYPGNFAVSVTRNAGGSVSYSLDGGPCIQGFAGDWIADGDGTCVFRAVQADDDAKYTPADPIVRQVTILPLPGSFDLAAPDTFLVYGSFSVDPINVNGGPITVTLVSGPCTVGGANSFLADAVGDCVFSAVQAPQNGYSTAASKQWTVEVYDL